MDGYGYQWKTNPLCCRAEEKAAGDGPCPSNCWFWLIAAGVLGLAILAPVKRGA